jgi:hypothetical protein
MLKLILPELMMLSKISLSQEETKSKRESIKSKTTWLSIEKLFKKKPLLDNKTTKLMNSLLLNTMKLLLLLTNVLDLWNLLLEEKVLL